MDTTDCLGLPFPECEPPLVKDASDIAQFKALADATDDAVTSYATALTEELVSPAMVIMQGSLTVAGTDVTLPLNGAVGFNTDDMGDTVADVIRVSGDGWYMIGGWVKTDSLVNNFMRVEPLLNGDPFSSRQGPSGIVATLNEQWAWADCGFFREGDALNLSVHHAGNPLTTFAYTYNMWAYQVFDNV